jgi:cytochrome b subunit of formate dehydrogenase
MDKPTTNNPVTDTPSDSQITYTRFDLSYRITHIIFLISFTILGITGLVQKFSTYPFSQAIIASFGGIENTRLIHHFSAIVMMVVSIYHVIDLLYRVYVLRVPWSMLPWISDAKHLIHDLGYYFGINKRKAYYGRYTYAEKMEYLAVVWGTIVMGITGFMMWNPITTAQWIPGQFIPAAKTAHGLEAILAVLAIILWHFYHVHLKHFNKSIFTGKLTRGEMKHEHPAELSEIETGMRWKRPPSKVIRRRQAVYFPVAIVLTAVFGFGAFQFISIEDTAITTVPKGETAQVFVPVTPTPRPTLTPTPTLVPGAEVAENTWRGKYERLFDNRCGNCHGFTAVGGLTLKTYEDALLGGVSGPGILPFDPDASTVVIVQSQGGHPGQLTIEELNEVIDWILTGAPEQ